MRDLNKMRSVRKDFAATKLNRPVEQLADHKYLARRGCSRFSSRIWSWYAFTEKEFQALTPDTKDRLVIYGIEHHYIDSILVTLKVKETGETVERQIGVNSEFNMNGESYKERFIQNWIEERGCAQHNSDLTPISWQYLAYE